MTPDLIFPPKIILFTLTMNTDRARESFPPFVGFPPAPLFGFFFISALLRLFPFFFLHAM